MDKPGFSVVVCARLAEGESPVPRQGAGSNAASQEPVPAWKGCSGSSPRKGEP